MKSLLIDFAPPSIRRSLVLTPFISWVALAISLAAWGLITFEAVQLLNHKASIDAALNKIMRQAQSRSSEHTARIAAAIKPAIPEARANAVNGAIAQLNLPWRDVFDAVEAATPSTIALLAIEPEARKHLIKGIAEARTSEAMVAYIETLKKEPLFHNVLLTRHETNEQDMNKPLRFQFEAQWSKAAP